VSYRPITDTWILARPKVPYYGAYPCGFLERARRFMPCLRTTPVLHACGGTATLYRDPAGPAWKKLCPNDVTCDLAKVITLKDGTKVRPNLVWNVRTNGLPSPYQFEQACVRDLVNGSDPEHYGWRGIIADPPYTPDDATHYEPGVEELPDPRQLVRDAMEVLAPGGRFGLLHYVWPKPPSGMKCIAKCSVIVGFNNRERVYSVYEKDEDA
jgi:SAM-dependent methyltransferase